MIQRRHKIILIVLLSFVAMLFFKAFPNDGFAKHIPFSDVEMVTKTWVYLGSDHVSHALFLFALIVAVHDDKVLRNLFVVLIGLELMSLIDYLLTYNVDFFVSEFDTNVVKLVVYAIMMVRILIIDILNYYAKGT